MKLADAVEQFLSDRASYASPRTVEWYKYMLQQLTLSSPIEAITENDLHRFLAVQRNRPRADLRSGDLSPFTIAGMVRSLRAFFHWCYEREMIDADPAKHLKMPRAGYPPHILTPKQIQKLNQQLQSAIGTNAKRDRALIYLLLDSGCRASEILSLSIERLNLNERWADVIGKGNKMRRVAFSESTADALRRYLRHRRNGPVFLNEDSTRFNYSGLADLLRRLSKRIGFHLNAHLFRHTMATLFVSDGGDLSHLQTLLGHRDVTTTYVYAASARTMAAINAGHKHSALDIAYHTVYRMSSNPKFKRREYAVP